MASVLKDGGSSGYTSSTFHGNRGSSKPAWLEQNLLRMLVDAGVVPQKVGKHHLGMEPQKPVDPQPDSEQARIRMIATEMVRQAVERHRFFTKPLPEADAAEEVIRAKR
jgi:hypothetical protein